MYDLDRQPKWVQDKFEQLTREKDRLLALLEAEQGGKVDYAGRMLWTEPVGYSLPHQTDITVLPQGTSVYFKQRHGFIQIRQQDKDMNTLGVMSVSHSLVIEPQVSNVVTIRMKRNDE